MPPSRFLDYIVYPDRERTEFSGAGIKSIQTNVGETGCTMAWSKITDQERRRLKTSSGR